jgi:hypothetical protein
MTGRAERLAMDARRRAVLRSVVGAVGMPALAGCFGQADALVRVLNDTETTVTVTTVIRDVSADRRVVEETFDLPPASEAEDVDERSRVFDDGIEEDATYEVSVSAADGPSGSREYDANVGRLWATVGVDAVDFQNVD